MRQVTLDPTLEHYHPVARTSPTRGTPPGFAAYPEGVPQAHVPSVTTAPVPLQEEQAGRVRQYLWTMGVRTACFAGAFFFDGWLRWVCVALAVLLPYFAVVLVNSVTPRGVTEAAPPAGPRRIRREREGR